MSNSPESELDLDLQFLPAWAQASPTSNPYAKYEGKETPDYAGRSSRKPRGSKDRNQAPRPNKERRFDRNQENRQGRQGQGPRRGHREALPPLPEIRVSLIPEKTGVESLVRQIKLTGRAYPVFDIAQLILKKPDRYEVLLETVKTAEGRVAQEVWSCNLDNTLWLSKSDAVKHVLARHFDTFYQSEKTPTDPPKGTYTFVAQCGMSGKILGPPNYHDYQSKLIQLHKDRFSRMPFETFKSRVKIVKDEEVVKKWIDEQSFKTSYICLNIPEPLTLHSLEEVEKHFLEVHADTIVKSEESIRITQLADRERLPGPLKALVRKTIEDQRRFPLRLVTTLSQQFAAHSLQFFKVNKTLTHVSVARPRYLDLDATPVSDGVKKIVELIKETPECTRRFLLEKLVPVQQPTDTSPPEPQTTDPGHPTQESEQPSESPAAAPKKPAATEMAAPTPQQAEVMTNLHWLIHQGHVIEFSTGRMEIAKKPVFKKQASEHKKKGPKPGKTDKGAVEPDAASNTAGSGQSEPVHEDGDATQTPADTTSQPPRGAGVEQSPTSTPFPAPAEGDPTTESVSADMPRTAEPEGAQADLVGKEPLHERQPEQ